MPEFHGSVYYPGLPAIASCTLTLSHGITPSCAIITVNASAFDVSPASNGTLTLTDGLTTIELPDCRCDAAKSQQSDEGTVSHWVVQDHRWRWVNLGGMAGCYNQMDENGKLIPWTIRSPTELAILCLQAMGETKYQIDLPPGLSSGIAAGIDRKFIAGENVPPTGTNPPINWNGIPPGNALQNLANQFGRRVVYSPSSGLVSIVLPGLGANLPTGGIHMEAVGVKNPVVPSGVMPMGSPTRYQARLALGAVGLEWDTSIQPINNLSYAPLRAGKVKIVQCSVVGSGGGAGQTWSVTITYLQPVVNGAGPPRPFTQTFSTTGAAPATIVAALVAQINASKNLPVKGILRAAVGGAAFLRLTGEKEGVDFQVSTRLSGAFPTPPAAFNTDTIQFAALPVTNWEYTDVPGFTDVNFTKQLTYYDAQQLARQSVWRWYRVLNINANRIDKLIHVPGYGPIVRREQLLLEPTQVDQIVPTPSQENLLGRDGRLFTLDLYNGYSRNKNAAVYGSARNDITYALWNGSDLNTIAGSQYFVDFEIDPVRQLVKFDNYVFYSEADRHVEPVLTLQTAVQVRNAETNWIECFTFPMALGGTTGDRTNYQVQVFPDVQLNVTSKYDPNNNLTSFSLLEADAIVRAQYYATGMAAQYIPQLSQTREYNQLVAVDLDGAIQQITYQIDGNFTSTVISRNSEHSVWITPYPQRRRAEALAPIADELNKDYRRGVNIAKPEGT